MAFFLVILAEKDKMTTQKKMKGTQKSILLNHIMLNKFLSVCNIKSIPNYLKPTMRT